MINNQSTNNKFLNKETDYFLVCGNLGSFKKFENLDLGSMNFEHLKKIQTADLVNSCLIQLVMATNFEICFTYFVSGCGVWSDI